MAQRKPNINWKDTGDDVLKMILRSLSKGKPVKKIETQTGKIRKQMAAQGKTARAGALKSNMDAVKKAATKRTAAERRAQADLASREAKDAGRRLADKMEITAKKGSGEYQSTTGRTKRLGKEAAAKERSRSGAMGSTAQKRWSKLNERKAALEKEMKTADAARKRAIRAELNKLRKQI